MKHTDHADTILDLVRHGVSDQHELHRANIDMLAGDLPHGINAPTFQTRKRMVMTSYMFNLVRAVFGIFVCLLFLFVMGSALISKLPDVDLFTLGIVTVSAFGTLYFVRHIRPNWYMYKQVKSVQTTRDIQNQEMKVSNLSIHSEADLAREFAKERLGMRGGGVMLMMIGGGMLHYLFTENEPSVFAFFYVMPLLFCMGLATFINPTSPAELMHTHGTPTMSWKHMPPITKLLLIIGGLAGIALFVQFEMGVNVLEPLGVTL